MNNTIIKHIITDLAEYDMEIELDSNVINCTFVDKLNICKIEGGIIREARYVNTDIVETIKLVISSYEDSYYSDKKRIIEWDGDMRLEKRGE